jgi:hypothetical protein
MTATGIVALFSLLAAASSGAHGSVGGLLSMLSAMRYLFRPNVCTADLKLNFSFLIGIGIGAEYPCGSVAASEQSEGPGINKNAQHRWLALATSRHCYLIQPWELLTPVRYHARCWFRSRCVCAPCIVLDVGPFTDTSEWFPDDYQRFGNDHLRAVWRLSLGLGVVPALVVFIWRLNMEPDRYKKDSMKHARIPYKLVIKRYGRSLAAISLIW